MAPVSSIELTASVHTTLYSCVNGRVSSISCGSFISRLFPGSGTGMYARRYSRSILTRPHSVTSKWPPPESVSEWIRSTTESVCLTSRWHTCTWQVAEIARRAQSALYSTVQRLPAAGWQLTSLTSGRCSGGRYVCMWQCGQRCQYQIARAPGHWLACPTHTSCVYAVHHALAWIFHVRL